jgi:DNA-binding NtrC family response regulator
MLARLPWHVRIEGPSGSGKNLAARLLHVLSSRARGPFIVCSLAMLPDGIAVEELVGHRRGAYTGAVEDRAGAFERAHSGTLFLDEIGTTSALAQQTLLDLVDGGAFKRLGEERLRPIDVRIAFATNENLETRVASGSFREDLYHRLGMLVLQMPALAEHPEDIPELTDHLLSEKSRQSGVSVAPLTAADMQRLMAYAWPGNVRQLDRAMEHYVAFGRLPDTIDRGARPSDWREQVDEVLRRCAGNKAAAARLLGVSRKLLYEELRRREA